MRLGIDIDGVLTDFTKDIIDLSNLNYGKNNKAEDVDRWEICECENIDLEEWQFKQSMDYYKWDKATPIRHNLNWIKYNYDKHDFFYITSRPENARWETLRWLDYHNLPITGLVFCSSSLKHWYVDMLRLDYMFDDNVDTVISCGTKGILIESGHNLKRKHEVMRSINRLGEFTE